MSWSNKSKISASTPRGRLLTPDGNRILVGENVDEILIYQAYLAGWGDKSKTDESGDWSPKSKISGS